MKWDGEMRRRRRPRPPPITQAKSRVAVPFLPAVFLALLLLSTAVLIIVHQVLVWGKVWEMHDVMHHEVVAVVCIVMALPLVFAALFGRRVWR